MQIFNLKRLINLLLIAFFSICSGFIAGIISGSLIKISTVPIETVTLNSANGIKSSIPELVKLKRYLGLKEDLQAQAVAETVAPSLIGFYKAKDGKNLLNQIYGQEDFLSNGFVLTSDGWMVAPAGIITKETKGKIIAIDGKKNIYHIENYIVDSFSNTVFLKTRANNLKVVVFGQAADLNLGQTVLAFNYFGDVAVVRIKNLKHQSGSVNSLVKSTDKISRFYTIDKNLEKINGGGVVVNLEGEVVGMVYDNSENANYNMVLPVEVFSGIAGEVLKNQRVKRPSLGIDYIEIDQAAGLNIETNNGLIAGALVYKNPAPGSPALTAGIQVNDIITRLDDLTIDANNNLNEIIQGYKVGDKIELTILRNQKEIIKEVFLGMIE